jgi:hypothetical protein
VPKGAYELAGGIVERFSCAPGPSGWRYVGDRSDGTRVDLTCDSRWRTVRLQVTAGRLVLRGGAVGRDLAWVVHGADDAVERQQAAAAFIGASPAYAVVVARLLGLAAGAAARVPLVLVRDDLLGVPVEQRWSLGSVATEDTDSGPLTVEQWEVADMATGDAATWHLAGDVVLAGPGIDLAELESPPSRLRES